jgi:hypothetical protein
MTTSDDSMKLPSTSTYCSNTTAVNAQVFDLGGGFRVWYSYRTPVAFQVNAEPILVRENDWGPTTGKHLNSIDGGDKSTRIPGAEFEARMAETLKKLGEVQP